METTYNDHFLADKRKAGDQAADSLIQALFTGPEQKTALKLWLDALVDNAALSSSADQYGEYPVVAAAGQLPVWANKKSMAEGASFFARHAETIMSLLGLLSLPYCYAAAQGAMVLHLSQRIKTDAGRRLIETAEFVWDVMAPDAFGPRGKGFASILKVRLMHAAVRYYTLTSGQWNGDWGTPINQEDMAGTNLSFSLIVIRGLRKWGYTIDYREQQAFTHLWNVIGSLMGLEEELLPSNGQQAFRLEEAIRVRQFKPSAHGKELTASLINYFSSLKAGPAFSPGDVLQVMRYTLGDEVAGILGIPPADMPPYKIRLLKLNSSINALKPSADTSAAYHKGYEKFRSLVPA